MQHMYVSGAVQPLKWPLGVKWLRYRSQKKDNMFRPFYYKAIIRSDMEN
jgi:hypothetical protein